MTETDNGVARRTVLMGVGAGPWQRTDVRPCARIAAIWSSDYWANKGGRVGCFWDTGVSFATR